MSTADAASREAAWLNDYNPADGLPALNVTNGGPFSIIQAYDPRTPGKRKNSIYVTRPAFHIKRFANIRQMPHYQFHVKLIWALSNVAGSEETEQASFDAAVDLVLLRILDLQGDKTHGGRFLQVAEAPEFVSFEQEDPVHTIPTIGGFAAAFTYFADDPEFIG